MPRPHKIIELAACQATNHSSQLRYPHSALSTPAPPITNSFHCNAELSFEHIDVQLDQVCINYHKTPLTDRKIAGLKRLVHKSTRHCRRETSRLYVTRCAVPRPPESLNAKLVPGNRQFSSPSSPAIRNSQFSTSSRFRHNTFRHRFQTSHSDFCVPLALKVRDEDLTTS